MALRSSNQNPCQVTGECCMQLEKEIQKAMGGIGEASTELSRKKEVSQKVKALKAEIHTHEADAAQLTAEHQHLQRQIASLQERLRRLETQVSLGIHAYSWLSKLAACLCQS